MTPMTPRRRVVVSLHGIRTRGVWQKELVPALAIAGFIPYVLDYGHVGALELLLPGSLDAKALPNPATPVAFEADCVRVRRRSITIVRRASSGRAKQVERLVEQQLIPVDRRADGRRRMRVMERIARLEGSVERSQARAVLPRWSPPCQEQQRPLHHGTTHG